MPPTLTPADLCSASPSFWATTKHIQLQSGEFAFKGMEYQKEPMESWAKRLCYMKAPQSFGVSQMEILKSLHGMIYERFPQGVLYLFPTTDDVGEYSKARFGPLLEANPISLKKFVKSQGKGTDTTSLKQVGKAFLYLRGARMTQSLGVGDEKGASKLTGISVDRVVFDEQDLFDDAAIPAAIGRMARSTVQQEVYIGNPSLPDYGIAATFMLSDQRHWFRRCGACGAWTCAELAFPGCVKVGTDGCGYIACVKCGRPVPIWAGKGTGEWVPAERANTAHMHGYQLGHLTSLFHDPGEILRQYENPPKGNRSAVIRGRIGLPDVSTEDQLTAATVLACCGQEFIQESHGGPCALGMDVGKIKHVVIGCRTGLDSYRIVKMCQVPSFDDAMALAHRFNVRSAVIDSRPYEDEARTFQKTARFKTFLSEYSENTVQDVAYQEDSGIVKVNRTEICDRSHRMFTTRAIEIPRDCPDVREFAKQCAGTAKKLETNKRTGTAIFRYVRTGQGGDHYRHATGYFLLAASGSRIARVGSTIGRAARAHTDYNEI